MTHPASQKTLIILLSCIAGFFFLAFLLWATLRPWWRKRNRARRPPAPPLIPPAPINLPEIRASQVFPSHPAVRRGIPGQPSSQLRQYDPRTETPFPNSPPLGDSVSLPSITPRSRSVGDLHTTYNSSNGLFSPIREVQRSRSGLPLNQTTVKVADFTLPLPEPCLLGARSAGKAPALKRQLEKFPIPRSQSSQADKEVHPNKLFKDLQRRSSLPGIDTPSPGVAELDKIDLDPIQDESLRPETSGRMAMEESNTAFRTPSQYEMQHWTLRRTNRRGTWSSNAIGDTRKGPMRRVASVTKLRTPVINVIAPQEPQSNIVITNTSDSQKAATTSSTCGTSTLSHKSENETSPPSTIEVSRVPPLPEYARGRFRAVTPDLDLTRQTPSSMAVPSTDLTTIQEDKPSDLKRASILDQIRPLIRHRPTRLNLKGLRKSASLQKKSQRHSVSSAGSLLVPLVKSKRPSIQASSVYSRDTLGVSIVHTPVSPAFSETALTGPTIKADIAHRKASSVDLLQLKIDDWRLDTPEIENFTTSPSSEFKRALSEFGPHSPTFPDSGVGSVYKAGMDEDEEKHFEKQEGLPTICVGRASDDIFSDAPPNANSARKLSRVLGEEVAYLMSRLSEASKKGTAPGGADWL